MKNNSILQFIPSKYDYLLNSEYLIYKDKKLKTAYLINIISDLISKYYYHKDDDLEKEIKMNISSIILKSKYGMLYNYYMEYLIENEFIQLYSDYMNGKKSKTYKLVISNILNIKHCYLTDKVIIKKKSPLYIRKNYLKYTKSPIPLDIRNRLIDDLYKVNININNSMNLIDMQKKDKLIDYNKYWKNKLSVENLANGQLFYIFDQYGRLHTNYTVLKKEIRKNFITINNENICEIDLENSQPLFLTVLLKQEMNKTDLIKKDVSRYIELTTNGLLYEEIMLKCDIKNRNDAKKIMYKILFGNNENYNKYNVMFYKLFPTVYTFIKTYKSKCGNYKSVSHKLQSLESEFIFNTVIRRIYNDIKDIVLFTVHDSICFPCKYKEQVELIFNYYKRNLLI